MSSLRLAPVVGLCLCLTPGVAVAQKSPEEELRSLVTADGLEIGVFAAEPMITNPTAIDVDTHGRVWVAEIQWYRKAAKQPPADKIKVLEDTDGDGRADKMTVFAEGVFSPMSVCVAGSKVYVATSPDLWVYEDADGDLRADGPPTKLLTGFGGFSHDHAAHSLVLGPDHKWWMAHGDAGYDVTGTDGSQITSKAGAMMRGELDGSQLENVATNFRNPYEVCINSFGEAFCSDNDNDGNFSARVCWILDGGDYGWFKRPGPKFPTGTPFGETWHFRGPIAGFVPGTLVTGFGSPCGMCYYEGDAFAELKNMPLHCDNGPREVRAYPHEKSGAGYKAKNRKLITCDADPYFRPDDVCAAPDGSLYVADWYDGGVGGHNYNNPDQGRIFRVTPKGKTLARVEKPGPYKTTAEAIVGLQSPNLATQFLAREKLLADGAEAVPALVKLITSAKDPNHAARALWVLDRIGGAGREEVFRQLDSADASLQALAVRILRRHHNDAAVRSRLPSMCRNQELTPETARELVLFLARRPETEAVAALGTLAARYAGDDRYFVEAVGIAARGREADVAAVVAKAKLGIEARVDLLGVLDPPAAVRAATATLANEQADEIARRTALDRLGTMLDERAMQTVSAAATSREYPSTLRARAVEWLSFNCGTAGLWSGLVGEADAAVSAWIDYKPAKNFNGRGLLLSTVRQLLSESDEQGPALTLIEKSALKEAGPDVVALINANDTTAAIRSAAIRTAVEIRADGAASVFAQMLKSPDESIRRDALNALIDLQSWAEVKRAVADKEQSKKVVERMMGSTGGALMLLKWIEAGDVGEAGRKQAVAKATTHPDVNVRTLFEKYIPEDQRPQRLGSVIKPEEILNLTGDAERGRRIFDQSSASQCKNCHIVRGIGKDLGPDLTQIGKKYERAALLETILEPSKAISHGYETYVAETDDGLIYAGFLVSQNDKQIVLRGADGKQQKIPAQNVESLTKTDKSIMPELVLKDVTVQDAADLLAYLMTLKEPLTPPGGRK